MHRLPRFLALAVVAGILGGLTAKGWKNARATDAVASPPTAASSPGQNASSAPALSFLPAARGTEPALALAEQITRALRTASARERDHAYHELLPRLITQDAPAAARLAEGWERGEQRTALLQEVARQWSDHDIAAALTWLAQLENPDRAGALDAAANQVGRTDAAGALELGQALQAGPNDGTLEHRLQLWTEETPVDAVAWVKARPAGPQRDRLLARAAYVRVQTNPPEAMELLQLMTTDPANATITNSVIRLWQTRDPAAASAWLALSQR